MEEYIESELSGIFPVKLVTKNIVRVSPETQFMHMRVKETTQVYLLKISITHNKNLSPLLNLPINCISA